MKQNEILMIVAIAVYLLGMLWIGLQCSKKNKNTDDFYLGGRKLGPFVTAMSAEASDMSGWLLMGLPGVAYLTGIADATWTAIGLAIGTYLNWLIVAKRIRNYSAACQATTIPAFFSKRFRDNSKILSIAAAIMIIVFFVPYTASGFATCGKLFTALFGVDYTVAMIICAIVIIFYTATGGFLAASTTDFVQSMVMTVALIVVLGFGVVSAGGFGAVIDNAKNIPGYFSLTESFIPTKELLQGSSAPCSMLSICSTLAWGLGYFGMPHVLLRFMAIEDASKLKLSRRVATVWVVISLTVAVLIGIIGVAVSQAGVIPSLINQADPSKKDIAETIIVEFAKVISQNGVIAALGAGVILAGILAATMSTADSQLLAASSSVSQNIVKEKLYPNMSEKTTMIIARLTLLIIALIGIFLARDPESSVFDIVSFAWAGFGAAFGPVVLFALFWKRTTKWGALAGMILGGAMVFIWKYIIANLGGIFAIYELLPAFIMGCIAIVVVSLLTKAPEQEVIDEFEAVKAMKD